MKNGVYQSLLLVEDDPDDQDLFELALQEVDANVKLEKARDGIEALERLQQSTLEKPELIILDINMPRMNGQEFLAEIKKDETLTAIPVVLYSTTSETNYVKDIVGLGARWFFKKPDSFHSLCENIRTAIQR